MLASGQSYSSAVSDFTGGVIGLFGLVAVLLNLLIFHILYNIRHQTRGSLGLQLVGMISCVDVISGLSGIFLISTRLAIGSPKMFESPDFCSGLGFVSIFSTGMSGMLVASLGVERYLAICKQRHASAHCLGVFIGFVFVILIFLLSGAARDGGLVVDASFSHCVPGNGGSVKVYYWGINFILISPISVLTFCYLAIFIKCLRLDCPSEHFSSRRLSLRALLFLFIYLACFFPKLVSVAWGFRHGRENRPITLQVLASLAIISTMAINPILVLFLNKEIRIAAYDLLRGKPSPI